MSSNRVNQLNQNEDDEPNITVRLYNLFILLIDIVLVHIKFWYYTFEQIINLFLTQEEADVKNDIVLITGTAHGIGKETALKYGRLGAKVVCWDINEKGNLETVEQINNEGGKAYHYVCDVTKRENIIELADKVKKDIGNVSILINNAGIMPCHSFVQHTETEIRLMFEINVMAHFWLIQCFLPDMIEKRKGNIVALSSCAGLFGVKNIVPYCGTKFAVRGYMQALAEELRTDTRDLSNIKLTTIYPYMVDTGLCKKPRYRFPKLMKLVTPEEAADTIITSQRRGIEECSVPKHFLYVERIMKLFPKKSNIVFVDFLDSGVDSDL